MIDELPKFTEPAELTVELAIEHLADEIRDFVDREVIDKVFRDAEKLRKRRIKK
jgi:hypothetical protein